MVPSYGKHLVMTRPGRSEHKIGLVSHLDTVFPLDEESQNNFAWRPEGDRSRQVRRGPRLGHHDR